MNNKFILREVDGKVKKIPINEAPKGKKYMKFKDSNNDYIYCEE